MTYIQFLLLFLVIPIFLLVWGTRRDAARPRHLPAALRAAAPWLPVAILVLVAVLYTTPWDNYLVASGVWYYNPRLVAGLTLGWVPIEEYIFFILQTIFTSLWLLWLARRLKDEAAPLAQRAIRRWSVLIAGLIWLGSAWLLFSGVKPGTYLALILVWALPPVMLQLAFGADILWRHRRSLVLALLSVTLYLGAADSLAISAGTWTIDAAQTTQIFLGGVLPIEEFAFFLMTNVLITFGLALALDQESRQRFKSLWALLASARWLGKRDHGYTP